MELRDMFSHTWFRSLAANLAAQQKNFETERFVAECMKGIKDLSLNQRMRRTSVLLEQFVPGTYAQKTEMFKQVIRKMNPGYTNLVFPDFVGLYGHRHFDHSMEALADFTRFGSSEFAIREFLKVDFDRTIKVMVTWAKDEDYHLRRLASEGSRPRLPWSFKLDHVIARPESTRPILEALHKDDALYVRKSVANHLNDFSKFAPEYMLDLCRSWDASDPRTAWIVRHASRSLIKKGNAASLSMLDFEKSPKIELSGFKLSSKKLSVGQSFEFTFQLSSKKKKVQKLAVDYVIHYQKQRGRSAKVFKLKELQLPASASQKITKKHAFADLSTRRHFPGKHLLEVQVNGKIMHTETFILKGE